jgi:cytochrome c biogenesis protein CcdA
MDRSRYVASLIDPAMPMNEPSSDDRNDEPFSPMRRARSRSSAPRASVDVGSVFGYTVSAVMAVVGVLVIAGFFVHAGVPDQFRWTFGVVLILMGIYRFFMTQTRRQRRRAEEEEDDA